MPERSTSRHHLLRDARERITVRPPLVDDLVAFTELARASRTHLEPWVQPPSGGDGYRAYLSKIDGERAYGRLLIDRESDEIAGVVNVSEIVRGAFHSAYLGYWIGAPYAGRGLMRDGLSLVIDEAFREQRLHRLEANVQPGNTRSIALVRALGFRNEGFSPKYLRIDGAWRDHERWAILAEEWLGS